MTEKEVRKLSRLELLDILVEQGKENDRLKEELSAAKEELASRQIAVEKSGTMAEAAMRLSGVFEAADKAAEDYFVNVKKQLLEQAEREANDYLENIKRDVSEEVDTLSKEYLAYMRSRKEEINDFLQRAKEKTEYLERVAQMLREQLISLRDDDKKGHVELLDDVVKVLDRTL